MTDEEVDIYNYLLAKEGKEKANEFLSFLDEDLNAREGGELAGRITGIDIPVVENLAIGLYGIGAGIDQWVSGTRQLFTNAGQGTVLCLDETRMQDRGRFSVLTKRRTMVY